VEEGVGTLEVCIAILDPQQFQLSGNVQINFALTLEPETATGTVGNCWHCTCKMMVQGLPLSGFGGWIMSIFSFEFPPYSENSDFLPSLVPDFLTLENTLSGLRACTTVTVLDDDLVEEEEELRVSLTEMPGSTVGGWLTLPSQTTITIVDDDQGRATPGCVHLSSSLFGLGSIDQFQGSLPSQYGVGL